MDLYAAWGKCRGQLVPQVQGDCGVFSFWYATVLLRELSPAGRPIVYPRAHPKPKATGWTWGPGAQVGTSIRHYARSSAGVNSGQGEILTRAEMEKIISHFGYKSTGATSQGDLRKAFVSRSLQQNQPVMFPYTKGATGPVNALNAAGVPGTDFGSHWSLIIKEDANTYIYLDPHYPHCPQQVSKDQVLESNANVDHQTYVQHWGKNYPQMSPHGPVHSGITPIGDILTSSNSKGFLKTYDIGKGGRTQKLANVLITVY